MPYNHQFFTNSACEFYPCHPGIEDFNCLFCYCPLYDKDCGGDYKDFGGIKDCSSCTLPHQVGSYEFVLEGLTSSFGKE